MSENELNETQPNPVGEPEPGSVEETQVSRLEDTRVDPVEETQPNPAGLPPSPAARKKFPGWLVALILLVLVAIGILGGYRSGMSRRYSAEGTLAAGQLQQAFELGLQAMAKGQYVLARDQFDFIIGKDPDYPGVRDAYTQLIMKIQTTPTSTPTQTPTITPTPDTRSVDEIYANVVALMAEDNPDLCGRDWDGIINKLDSLRKADINFHTAEVDGMYFVSLRNRGECKIYPQRYEANTNCADLGINLEGGILDLTMAERFGPLDNDAAALRTWARLYNVGASFWDQDWVQAKGFFRQVMDYVPYLSDSSCTTATERWRQATIGYTKKLTSENDYCGAENQLTDLFNVDSPKNEAYKPVLETISRVCNGETNLPVTLYWP
jgi:hypothetical protein